MIVYYVNRNARFKGPFDIIDSKRQHIIKVGDICLRDTIKGVEFLVITGADNYWNACKRVGVGDNDALEEIGNTLVLSFDGLHKRRGDLNLIVKLASCFREKAIVDFFSNAKDILEYKTDFWDASLFVQFLAQSQILIDRKTETSSSAQPVSKEYPTCFAQYLHENLLRELNANLKKGKGLKEAYMIVRDQYPSSFRDTLMTFLRENPGRTIYEKPIASYEPIKNEPEPTPIKIQREVSVDEYDSLRLNEKSKKELKKLFVLYHKGDKNAFNKIVLLNQKLVEVIAKTYIGHGVEYKDLVQEGTLGLIKAIDRFDYNRKVAFPFYAKWWIQQFLISALINQQSMVRLPSNQMTLFKKVRKSIERYEQEYEYEPSASDIDVEGCDDVVNINFLSSLPENLQEITTTKDDLDSFANDSSADDVLIQESRTYFINTILNKLKSREATILRFKYGIGEKMETMEEIGVRFGLTRERVRQISEKAVRHLREILKLPNIQSEHDEEENITNESKTDNCEKKTKTSNKKESKPRDKNRIKPQQVEWVSNDSVSHILRGDGLSIENTGNEFSLYKRGSLVFHSEGNAIMLQGLLYRVFRTETYLIIHQLKQKGPLFRLGRLVIYAGKTSPLYKKLDKSCYCRQINSIVQDLVPGCFRIKADHIWYDENGIPIIESDHKFEQKIEEKKKIKAKAKIGDELLYDSNRCVVLEKLERGDTKRLKIEYEDGTIDNVIDDEDRYIVLVNTDNITEDEIEDINEDVSNETEVEDIEEDDEDVVEDDEEVSEEEDEDEWYFVNDVDFIISSKRFLSYECRVVLSPKGYYLEVEGDYIKLGNYSKGFSFNRGVAWIKRPNNDKGFRMVHLINGHAYLIGYLREEDNIIIFTTPDDEEYTITLEE